MPKSIEQISDHFIGLDTQYLNADKQLQTRIHLDGAASPLAYKTALETINALLPHYSNTHSVVHNSAQISTQAYAWAHQQVLNFLSADKNHYSAVFTGTGTTAGINRLARGLKALRPERNIVLVSSMEHHANDLPHRQFSNEVIYLPLNGEGQAMGAIDLSAFEALCAKHQHNINYLAVSSVSNVTGIHNPIKELTTIAHKYDILVLVDAAQSVAHKPISVEDWDVDFLLFSGHKFYTPMSPGVIVAKNHLLADMQEQDLGGGSVSSVSFYDFDFVANITEKEESGTPNIVGAIALASVLNDFNEVGMKHIEAKDSLLMSFLISQLETIDDIRIYGDKKLNRIGALSFNHKYIDHGLLAAILNDYYGIAVRNECFCAHPYVSSLLKEELWQLDLSDVPEEEQESFINRKRGMVRASLSVYNTQEEVLALVDAIKEIALKVKFYKRFYEPQTDGSYRHHQFSLNWKDALQLN